MSVILIKECLYAKAYLSFVMQYLHNIESRVTTYSFNAFPA